MPALRERITGALGIYGDPRLPHAQVARLAKLAPESSQLSRIEDIRRACHIGLNITAAARIPLENLAAREYVHLKNPLLLAAYVGGHTIARLAGIQFFNFAEAQVDRMKPALHSIIASHPQTLKNIPLFKEQDPGEIARTIVEDFKTAERSALSFRENTLGMGTMVANLASLGLPLETAIIAGVSIASLATSLLLYNPLIKRKVTYDDLIRAETQVQIAAADFQLKGLESFQPDLLINRAKSLATSATRNSGWFVMVRAPQIAGIFIGNLPMLLFVGPAIMGDHFGMVTSQLDGKAAGNRANQQIETLLQYIERGWEITTPDEWEEHRKKARPIDYSKAIPSHEKEGVVVTGFTSYIPAFTPDSEPKYFTERAEICLQPRRIYVLNAPSGEGKTVLMQGLAHHLDDGPESHIFYFREKSEDKLEIIDAHDHAFDKKASFCAYYPCADFTSSLTTQEHLRFLYLQNPNRFLEAIDAYQQINNSAPEAVALLQKWVRWRIDGSVDAKGDQEIGKALTKLIESDSSGPLMLSRKLRKSETLVRQAATLAFNIIGWDLVQALTVTKLFNEAEIQSVLKHRIEILSSGQRQRLSLIFASMMRPIIVLLDEPFERTGARGMEIDVLSGREHIAALINRIAEQGSTVILTTHLEDMSKRRLLYDLSRFGGEFTFTQERKLQMLYERPTTDTLEAFMGFVTKLDEKLDKIKKLAKTKSKQWRQTPVRDIYEPAITLLLNMQENPSLVERLLSGFDKNNPPIMVEKDTERLARARCYWTIQRIIGSVYTLIEEDGYSIHLKRNPPADIEDFKNFYILWQNTRSIIQKVYIPGYDEADYSILDTYLTLLAADLGVENRVVAIQKYETLPANINYSRNIPHRLYVLHLNLTSG